MTAGRSGYVIVLSGDERAELECRVACYTLAHKVVVRTKMILYAADGESTAEIGRRQASIGRLEGGYDNLRLITCRSTLHR